MDEESYARAQALREQVVGKSYVDRSVANTTEFNAPMQDLIVRYVWGEIWSRPELERKSRSIINLALLAALKHPDELRLHVGGALRNGCSVAEIREVLLQVAVYCGVPVALEAFRVVQDELDRLGDEVDRLVDEAAVAGPAS
jgi:4-carboxymuconolactone decarboxylase